MNLYYQDERLLVLCTCSIFFKKSIDGFGLVWKEKQYVKDS